MDKNDKLRPGNGTPTADLLLEVSVELDSLYVPVGTKITTHGSTFLCVDQDPIITPIDGEDTPVLCAGCDAPWTLCRIMRCSARQRSDRSNVQFKIIARHE